MQWRFGDSQSKFFLRKKKRADENKPPGEDFPRVKLDAVLKMRHLMNRSGNLLSHFSTIYPTAMDIDDEEGE